MRARAALAVGVGGLAGAGVRWAAEEVLLNDGGWPWAVFAVNLLGCFVLGVLVERADRDGVLLHVGLTAGFCSSLTTFSALTVDTMELARGDRIGLAAAYLGVSLVAGLAAVLAGRGHRSLRLRVVRLIAGGDR